MKEVDNSSFTPNGVSLQISRFIEIPLVLPFRMLEIGIFSA
jgi:hypothetical protein